MEDTFIIDSVDQLKIFADPLRQRILQSFCCNPATTKQIAAEMGEKPTRLYHHVHLLEQIGFIKIVDTKQNRGTIEKYYQSTAKKFVIDHALVGQTGLDAGNTPADQNLLINTLQACLVEARDFFVVEGADSQGKNETPSMIAQAKIRLSKTQVDAFIEKCCDLMEELSALESDDGELMYSLTLALFPVQGERVTSAAS
jgi:hypothetical protein